MGLLCRRENFLNEKGNYILRYTLRKAKPERTLYPAGRTWPHLSFHSTIPVELRLGLVYHAVPASCKSYNESGESLEGAGTEQSTPAAH